MGKVIARVRERQAGRGWAERATKIWAGVSVVLAGIWGATQFFWKDNISPRLEAAIVQVSHSSKVVATTACCDIVELETKLENKGRRDAVIHSSQIAIGARSFSVAPSLNALDTRDLINDAVLKQNSHRQTDSAAFQFEWSYGAAYPDPGQYLILTVGHLVDAALQLAPGEVISRQSVLTVPRSFPYVTVRSQVVLGHDRSTPEALNWHWSALPETLEIQKVPWPTNREAELMGLFACAHAGSSASAGCVKEIRTKSADYWNSVARADGYAYYQSTSYEFYANAEPNSKSAKIEEHVVRSSR